MPKLVKIDFEARSKAWRLFVEEGLSFREVAGRLGQHEDTVRRWSCTDRPPWTKQRTEYWIKASKFRLDVHKVKCRLAGEAAKDKKIDSQTIYALTALMRADAPGVGQVDKAQLFLDWLENLAQYLRQRDPEALKYLEPHIRGYAEEMKAREG